MYSLASDEYIKQIVSENSQSMFKAAYALLDKQGRIAKAIRTVMRATANRSETKISVEID